MINSRHPLPLSTKINDATSQTTPVSNNRNQTTEILTRAQQTSQQYRQQAPQQAEYIAANEVVQSTAAQFAAESRDRGYSSNPASQFRATEQISGTSRLGQLLDIYA
ncbi:MAG: hypothetical protein P1U57_11415 [Oleibacter sp.]|nr:hypothetical protein [Thalassolituus sp.]